MSGGPTRGPIERPGPDRDFAEIFQRIVDLERAYPGGGFIRYVFTNVGEWLYVKTTGSGGPLSAGIAFVVSAVFRVNAVGDIHVTSSSGDVAITGRSIDISAQTSTLYLESQTDAVQINAALDINLNPTFGSGGDVRMTLVAGHKVVVLDALNNPIFEAREDGTVHIKTGTAIIADL